MRVGSRGWRYMWIYGLYYRNIIKSINVPTGIYELVYMCLSLSVYVSVYLSLYLSLSVSICLSLSLSRVWVWSPVPGNSSWVFAVPMATTLNNSCRTLKACYKLLKKVQSSRQLHFHLFKSINMIKTSFQSMKSPLQYISVFLVSLVRVMYCYATES